MSAKTIFIAGASGFIGGYLARRLAAQGHTVYAGWRTRQVVAAPNLIPIRVDLAGLDDLPGPVDAVIQAAAENPDDVPVPASLFVRNNAQAAARLAQLTTEAGARLLVNLSAVSIYGTPRLAEIDEESPLAAPSIYGATKYIAELVFAEHADRFATVSLRMPGVVGPCRFKPWLGQVLRKALAGEPIRAYNPEAPFNNVFDLDNLGRFVEGVLAQDHAGSTIVNAGAGDRATVGQVVETLLSRSGSRSPVKWESGRPSFAISIERLRTRYGFSPSNTLDMVGRFVDGTMAVTRNGLRP